MKDLPEESLISQNVKMEREQERRVHVLPRLLLIPEISREGNLTANWHSRNNTIGEPPWIDYFTTNLTPYSELSNSEETSHDSYSPKTCFLSHESHVTSI